jgi:hypothetical protein
MAGNSGLLNAKQLVNLRTLALAFWLACVLLIAVPALIGSPGKAAGVPFRQPVQPPGPHPAMPLKQ